MPYDNAKVIHTQKLPGNRGEIRYTIVKDSYKEVYLDIRKWVDTDKYSGPTKQGIMIPKDQVMDMLLSEVLDKAAEAFDEV